jgi:predicted site-specific integrase-resolvase
MEYLSPRNAAKVLGVHTNTLRNWADAGIIKFIWTHTGYRRYDVYSVAKPDYKLGHKVVYARVSSYKQKDDLVRQVQKLKQEYPGYEIVTDIGGGLNFKRKGLRSVLELAMRGAIKELVVAHRDRLCRFGFELVKWMVEKDGGKLVVLDDTSASPEKELTDDLLAILHVFSCRMHGLRAYSNQIKRDRALRGGTGKPGKVKAGSKV